MRALLIHPATPWIILALLPFIALGSIALMAADMPKPDFKAYACIAFGASCILLILVLPPIDFALFWRRYSDGKSISALIGLILAAIACLPLLGFIIGGLINIIEILVEHVVGRG